MPSLYDITIPAFLRGFEALSSILEKGRAFAREKGYRKLMLWTQRHLTAARRIYQSRGFERVRSDPYAAFGQKMVSEVWELKL